MEGHFTLKNFLVGKGKEDWYKTWGYGWRLIITLGIILLLVTGIKSFFVKPQQNTVTVATGGKAIFNQGEQRKWWIPYLFVEPYWEVNSYAENPIVGARFGLRWEK